MKTLLLASALHIFQVIATINGNAEVSTIACDGHRTINMTDRGLSSIPVIDQYSCGRHGPLKMLLANNSIVSLSAEHFRNCSGLELLNMSRNSISTIANDVFKWAHRINDLDLSFNQLQTLDGDVFSNLPLTRLYLRENLLVSLDAFTSRNPQLAYLDLSYNRLFYIPRTTFHHSDRLRHIDFSHNRLEAIDSEMFAGTESLRIALFRNNRLRSIPKMLFANCSDLKRLDFSGNQLGNHPVTLDFAATPSTSFRSCNLTSLPRLSSNSASTELTSMDITGNPVQCNCSGTKGGRLQHTGSIVKCFDGTHEDGLVCPTANDIKRVTDMTSSSTFGSEDQATIAIPAGHNAYSPVSCDCGNTHPTIVYALIALVVVFGLG